jgi:hypothetical protein
MGNKHALATALLNLKQNKEHNKPKNFIITLAFFSRCTSIVTLGFLNRPNPSCRTMILGSTTQPLTEMSARNLPGGKGRPARKAHNLTAICEQTVLRQNVGASNISQPYWDSLTFTFTRTIHCQQKGA